MSAHEQDLNETIAVLNARLESRHIEATEQSGQIGDLGRAVEQLEEGNIQLALRADRAETERAEIAAERDALKAAIECVRADCEAVAAEGFIADDNPALWVNGARAYAKRVLALLGTEATGSEAGPAAEAFMAWIEKMGYRPEAPGGES